MPVTASLGIACLQTGTQLSFGDLAGKGRRRPVWREEYTPEQRLRLPRWNNPAQPSPNADR